MDATVDDYYRQERKDVEALIPGNAQHILDVGCGEGILGKRLLEKGVKEVVGIEINQDVCDRAKKNLSRIIHGDIEEIELTFDAGHFDCVVLADILEHLRYPLLTLKKLKRYLSHSGTLVASIPNIRYWGIINMLVEGHWKYADYGILDKTHLRFFTKKEIEGLFTDLGFEITCVHANIDHKYYELHNAFSGEIAFGRVLLQRLATEELQDLFVTQYIISARHCRITPAEEGSYVSNETFIKKKDMKKIAIVRGANLNKWEIQNYEPLLEGFDITSYTTTQTRFDIDQVKMPVVKLPFQSQGLFLHMEGLEEHLADKDLIYTADITHQFSAQAVEAKKKYGCKVVCLEWENVPFNFEEHDSVRSIKETVRKEADHFIAVTNRAKEALVLEGVPEEKIDVIPMGIDLSKFKPDAEDRLRYREQLGIGGEETVILFIGRMVWEKGVYDFVHAAARICCDGMLGEFQVKFVMVGKGPELDAVRARAEALGIAPWIMFIENCPYHEMHRMHNIADIFILPSILTKTWQEQFGMVLIESMACGKPVISTLSGSIPEVVGNAGILVQPNDHGSLYEALRKLIVGKDMREDLGKKALSRAEREFDSRKTAVRVKMVFEKVLSRQSKADSVRDMYLKGLKCRENGDNEESFQLVCSAFDEDPNNKEILDSLVVIGKEMKKLEKVEASLREYLNYHPADLDVLITLAETMLHIGKRNEAEEELRKVFIFEPDNIRASAIMKEIKAVLVRY
jgi:starch synthase